MPDILLNFPVNAPVEKVFDAIAAPEGLSQWWTLRSDGKPIVGTTYELYFAKDYDWRAAVIEAKPPHRLVLKVTDATPDWLGTQVSFTLAESDG